MIPMLPPRVCGCGKVVAYGVRCECQVIRDRDRKARFDATRPSARERGYDSKWDIERAAYLKANPTCRLCGAPASLVDHIIPHRRDMRLFWRRSNWQPLCTPCHSGHKQRQERRP